MELGMRRMALFSGAEGRFRECGTTFKVTPKDNAAPRSLRVMALFASGATTYMIGAGPFKNDSQLPVQRAIRIPRGNRQISQKV
jgi:hypothetical protein